MIERKKATRSRLRRAGIAEAAFRRRLRRGGILVGLAALTLCACGGPEYEGPRYPGDAWSRYASPEEAGWSSEGLREAKAIYDEIGSDAFLAVYDGAVLVAWGDNERRFMCHSVRKSFLSALCGIAIEEGKIRLNETLAELGIDDVPPLTASEKQTYVVHLLMSRSGVYHAAAYETPAMKAGRPQRGRYRPGEFWYYNNWDFNALCTIFEQETGTKIFEEFKRRIADPLGMQDFRLMDTYYHLESQHSVHPAYPFRMSARDMARFGLLYLREGKWRNRTIVPEDWVITSLKPYSETFDLPGFGYGYLWWVDIDTTDRKLGMYAALGYGGQMIAVLPQENLVLVHRSNTYLNERVPMSDILRLVDAVLDAKASEPSPDPKIVPLEAQPRRALAGPDVAVRLKNYTGAFRFDSEELFDSALPYVIGDMIGQSVRIGIDGRNLLMTDNLGQKFVLVPRSATECIVEEMEVPLRFEMDEEARPVGIVLDGSPAWRITGTRIDVESGNERER